LLREVRELSHNGVLKWLQPEKGVVESGHDRHRPAVRAEPARVSVAAEPAERAAVASRRAERAQARARAVHVGVLRVAPADPPAAKRVGARVVGARAVGARAVGASADHGRRLIE
jgi:hypothetical protein